MIQSPDQPTPNQPSRPDYYRSQFGKQREITPETRENSQKRRDNFAKVLPVLEARLAEEGISKIILRIVGSVAADAADENSDIDIQVDRMTFSPPLTEVTAYAALRRVLDKLEAEGLQDDGLLKYAVHFHQPAEAFRWKMDQQVRQNLLAEYRKNPQ